LSEQQLEWLADELSTPAPDGTILALHHPPVPCVQDLAVLVELRDQGRLAAVVGNSDVRAILGGHLHYSTSATFAGVPVSVASATCYTQDLAVGAGGQRGRDGAQAYNMVHVYEDTIVHSVVPLSGGDTVGEELDAEGVRRRLEAAGVAIPGQSRTRFRGKTRLSTSPKVP
jgi:3',5'-cyclic AMP phosphodiesterase CpdA